MKKQAVVLALVAAVLTLPFVAFAEQVNIEEIDDARAAVIMEVQTGTRLWSKEADGVYAVAGLSKLPAILTLAQAVDDGLIDETATMQVSQHAASISGPTAFLESGEQIAASQLIKAAVMISAGDAIMTLGENAFGSESVFAENINATLRQLGLNKTITDAMGQNLLLSAWDLAALGAAASQSPTFSKYCTLYLDSISHADGRETELVNANRLINNYSGCNGLLTGSSAADGYSGVFSVQRNGTNYIAVVIGAPSALRRTVAAVALLDYGFANFRTETLAKSGVPMVTAMPVRDGNVKTVDLTPGKTQAVVLESAKGKLTQQMELPEYLEAPLSPNEPVGVIRFADDAGTEVAVVELYPAMEVEAFGMMDILLKIAGRFIS